MMSGIVGPRVRKPPGGLHSPPLADYTAQPVLFGRQALRRRIVSRRASRQRGAPPALAGLKSAPRKCVVAGRAKRLSPGARRRGTCVERILEGKTGIVFGVANKRSLAWACAQSLSRAGMRLALTYAGERVEKSVRELAEELPDSLVLPCDVTQPETIDQTFDALRERFGYLDTVVHAIAFAKREELEGDFYHTSKEGYMLAHEVSAYSLTAIARRALPLMEGRQGSL